MTATRHFLRVIIRNIHFSTLILAGHSSGSLLIDGQIIDIQLTSLDTLYDIPFNLLNIRLTITLNLYLMRGDDLHLILEHLLFNDGRIFGLSLADL